MTRTQLHNKLIACGLTQSQALSIIADIDNLRSEHNYYTPRWTLFKSLPMLDIVVALLIGLAAGATIVLLARPQ